MAAHPLGFIVAGLSCLGVGAAAVTIAASPGAGADAAVEEEAADAKPMTLEERYLQLDALRLDCATGAGGACMELALAYETREDLWGHPVKGDGVKRDDSKAAHYFRLACDLGAGDGCARLAHLYEAGKGVRKDREEAARLYRLACDSGGAGACEGEAASEAAPARRGASPGLRP